MDVLGTLVAEGKLGHRSEALSESPPPADEPTAAPDLPGLRTAGRHKIEMGLIANFSRAERRRLAALLAAIAGLHVLGALILFVLVLPHHFSLSGHGIFGLGIALTAYLLGLRHAVDADHICAIDNTTRKLMADGKRPLTVGFFFSFGHSSVVFALVLMLTLGIAHWRPRHARRIRPARDHGPDRGRPCPERSCT